jgi:flagellar hook-length control protein FliK
LAQLHNQGQPAADTGKTPGDGPQIANLPQPADRAGNFTATAAHASSGPSAPEAAPEQRVPFAGIPVEIAAHARAGRNRFEIRLDPPELGRIDVRLDVDRSGHVTSRLVVEKAETLDMLRRDAPELERALQQVGLRTSDSGLQFALRDQSFAGRDDRPALPDAERMLVADASLDPVGTLGSDRGSVLRLGSIDIRV